MPNRIVRDGFLDSEAINALGDAAECFYHRLLLAADDAGRMDGRVEMLRARLFPLSSRRASDVEKQLSECVAKGLVIPYEWNGKPFVQLAKWQRCSPCVTSKYPWKDGSHRIEYVRRETRDGDKEFVVSSLSHTEGIAHPLDPLSHECPETETYTKTETKTALRAGFARFWEKWPKRVARAEAERAWLRLAPGADLEAAILTAVAAQSARQEWAAEGGKFIPHPATWLNGRRWEDQGFVKPSPPPKPELPRCIEPGCTSDGAPIWGGRCQVHHAQRKPLTPAQAQAGIVRAA